MDGEAGWWTTCGNIGLPPLARVMGVGRQQQQESRDKINQYTRTLDDDDMVEHLDILDKETQLITEWTTLGTGKYTWAWAGAIKNKKGTFLGHSSSKK